MSQPRAKSAVGSSRPSSRGHASNPSRPSSRGPVSLSSNSQHQRKIVGQYILGKTIGEGTFGKVKLAIHQPTGEKVNPLPFPYPYPYPSFHS